jgi:DnaA family protein
LTNQLHLPIRLRDSVSLDNFFPDGNEEVFAALKEWLTRDTSKLVLFLYGAPGSGRSHLLQAACRFVSEEDRLSVYVPAGEPSISRELISQLDPESTVCIDDLDHVVGDMHWEESILEVHERLLSGNGRLLLAALQPPRVLGLLLPDLATRLAAGAVYRIQPLTERELPRAMQLRAQRRGLELPDEVVEYLMRRVPRNSEAIFDLLDRVDEAAFAQKRRLTIPFIRAFEKEQN